MTGTEHLNSTNHVNQNFKPKLLSQLKEFSSVGQQAWYCFSPGRLNFIGDHVDYCGGMVFPGAINLGTHAVAALNGTDSFRARSLSVNDECVFGLGSAKFSGNQSWANYLLGTFKMLEEHFGPGSVPGMDIVIDGDLPLGAALSSSASLLVCALTLMEAPNQLRFSSDPLENNKRRALFAQSVETGFIGLQCGIMDQASIVFGKQDLLMLMDCSNISIRYVPFVAGRYDWVIANTCKPRRLSESKYNERRKEADEALEQIRLKFPVSNLCEVPPDKMQEALDMISSDIVRRRARHILSENQRVNDFAVLLAGNDYEGAGKKLTESHISLKDDYEVTGPELDAIVSAALEQPGVLGARMTGAGFAGCALFLCESARKDDIIQKTASIYSAKTGLTATFYPARISDGAFILPIES